MSGIDNVARHTRTNSMTTEPSKNQLFPPMGVDDPEPETRHNLQLGSDPTAPPPLRPPH